MINFDYFYYIVYEFEVNGGQGQGCCEYKTENKITQTQKQINRGKYIKRTRYFRGSQQTIVGKRCSNR